MLEAKVTLTQPLHLKRQFVGRTGTGHHLLLDDADGGTGPKPIELVALGMAGCTAFDVITFLRQKRHQKITGYEVRVEADQAECPPQVFTAVRVHHVVTGHDVDPAAVEEAIRLSEGKYCSVEAMLRHTASFATSYDVIEEQSLAASGNGDKPQPVARARVGQAISRSSETTRLILQKPIPNCSIFGEGSLVQARLLFQGTDVGHQRLNSGLVHPLFREAWDSLPLGPLAIEAVSSASLFFWISSERRSGVPFSLPAPSGPWQTAHLEANTLAPSSAAKAGAAITASTANARKTTSSFFMSSSAGSLLQCPLQTELMFC